MASSVNERTRDLVYIDGELHHALEGVDEAFFPATCAYADLQYGDCEGSILKGEGYVAVMPLGVVHMRHVDLMKIEMPA